MVNWIEFLINITEKKKEEKKGEHRVISSVSHPTFGRHRVEQKGVLNENF